MTMSFTHVGHRATTGSMRCSLQKMSLGHLRLGARRAMTAASSSRLTGLGHGGSSYTITTRSLSPLLARIHPATVLTLIRTYGSTVSTTKKNKSTTAKKTTVKSTAAKKTKKAAKKPAKKKKAAAKKPAAKKPVKKTLTPEAKEKAKIKALLEQSLKQVEPRHAPVHAWELFASESLKNMAPSTDGMRARITNGMKKAGEEYRSLDAGDIEALNHRANQKTLALREQYDKWLAGTSPADIHKANLARYQLKKKEVRGCSRLQMIKDPRIPKKPPNAYALFYKERYASGDFRHIKVTEASKLIGKEWKEAPASERQRFEDVAKPLREEYKRDHPIYAS